MLHIYFFISFDDWLWKNKFKTFSPFLWLYLSLTLDFHCFKIRKIKMSQSSQIQIAANYFKLHESFNVIFFRNFWLHFWFALFWLSICWLLRLRAEITGGLVEELSLSTGPRFQKLSCQISWSLFWSAVSVSVQSVVQDSTFESSHLVMSRSIRF